MVYFYKVDRERHPNRKVKYSKTNRFSYHAIDTDTSTSLIEDIIEPILSMLVKMFKDNEIAFERNDYRTLIATYPDAKTFYQNHPEYIL